MVNDVMAIYAEMVADVHPALSCERSLDEGFYDALVGDLRGRGGRRNCILRHMCREVFGRSSKPYWELEPNLTFSAVQAVKRRRMFKNWGKVTEAFFVKFMADNGWPVTEASGW